jgi:hypothetical protein
MANDSGSAGESARSHQTEATVHHDQIVIKLDPKVKERAEECLRQTGSVRVAIKELAVTKLGAVTNAEVIVN